MSTLHSSPLHWAFGWHRSSAGWNQQHHNIQVGIRSCLLVAAAAAATAKRSSPTTRPDFWVDDDDTDHESSDEEDPNELLWVRQARELAIQAMSDRAFTDKDFEALLPAKLREKKKKRKPKLPKKEDALVVSIKAIRKQRKQQKQLSDKRQQVMLAVPAEPVAQESIDALARKFNVQRLEERDPTAVPQVDFSVVYPDDSAISDDESSEDDVVTLEDPRLREIHLNQDIVECRDVEEVLGVVSSASERFRLSPINVATALHRIAKHMVKLSMSDTKRLRVARQKEMCELVASAMELLRDCSAQGLSNIAWALSKVGGSLLYSGEMDLIARVAVAKCQELNSQNVANIAGAFAFMQHDSPGLFSKLACRAREVARDFRAQEVSQALWAFAAMDQPVPDLLDELDEILLEHRDTASSEAAEEGNFLSYLKLEDLASMAWSYAVFGQLQRPLFAHICDEILKSKLNEDNSQTWEQAHACQLSQLHQANLSMKLEWSHLGLALGTRVDSLSSAAWEKEKNSRKSTSLLQKDMERFLFYTGRKWIPEYKAADYSLDFALVDEKIGLEVDGPTHFSRNTGKPLGHMILKRRLLQSSGWTILSASHEEWERLATEAEQIDYVKNLIAPHLEHHCFPVKTGE